MRRSIQLDGRLDVTNGDNTISIVAEGSEVSAEIGGLAAEGGALRNLASSLRRIRSLARAVDLHGLTLTVTRHGKPVVRVGARSRSARLLRFLGLRPPQNG